MWSIIRKKQNKKGEEGFTLIELIVVIAILGFLLAIAIPRYTTAREKAAINATKANLHNLANAVEIYITDNNLTGTTALDYTTAITATIPGPPQNPQKKSYIPSGTFNANSFYIQDPDTYNNGGTNPTSAPLLWITHFFTFLMFKKSLG